MDVVSLSIGLINSRQERCEEMSVWTEMVVLPLSGTYNAIVILLKAHLESRSTDVCNVT